MTSLLIDKQRIASSFSKAATTYDGLADFQRQVGNELLQYLPADVPAVMLDLGCGTGYFTPKLKAQFPGSYLLNLDLALGMLTYARAHRPAEQTRWLCADAEVLPIADKSVDLIFSSLAIQWCSNPVRLFAEIERVLKPGGRFVFTTLGPQTLYELKRSWAAADGFVHVNQFIDADALQLSFAPSLNIATFKEELKVLKYQQLKELTDELKGIGAHNMNTGQQSGLMGREKLRRFKQAYEAQRLEGGALPATYQVFTVALEKSLEN